jgi:short subunit dehydrogenase-like uncharacterized protein
MARIVVFGATGFTGRLVAERLVAAGASPVLAGRDPDRLRELAARLGADLECVRADVYRRNSMYDLVGRGDVLVSTVGPFVKYGSAAVEAALEAGAAYLDSTGEPLFIRRVFEEYGPQAADALLMPAMGFDFVPGALAGALALDEAGPDAVRVDVGYYSLGGGTDFASTGTKASLVGVSLDPSYTFRDGALVVERGAARVRSFAVRDAQRPAVSTGAAEHFTLPAAYPALREVNAYIGWFGPLSRAVQGASLATSVMTRLPGARTVMQYTGERLVALTPSRTAESDASSLSWVVGEAYAADGTPLAEVHLSGADAYEFTGAFIAWAATRAAAGLQARGAAGPLEAFGLEALEAGCAEAGIARAA